MLLHLQEWNHNCVVNTLMNHFIKWSVTDCKQECEIQSYTIEVVTPLGAICDTNKCNEIILYSNISNFIRIVNKKVNKQ